MHRTEKGFTLIELLVVIAIIGLLSSVVLASLNNARTKSRDARRQADLKQIANALELYQNVHNAYPILTTQNTTKAGFETALDALETEGHIPNLPVDPSWSTGNTPTYYYRSTTGGGYYCIGANIEGTAPASSCVTGSAGLGSAMSAPVDYSVGP